MRMGFWLGVAAVVALTSMPAVRAQEAPKNADSGKKLIGYWHLNEGAGLVIKDSSGSGKDGKILNDSRGVKWVDGRSGKALEFIGGDPKARDMAGCVEIPNMGDVDFNKGMTVEAWVKLTKLGDQLTYELMDNVVGDAGPGWRFMIQWKLLMFMSGQGGEANPWLARSNDAVTKLNTAAWHHVAATYDGTTFKIYYDGTEAASKPAASITKGRNSMYIGAYWGGYAYGLNAVMSDVKLYNYARSAEEVLADAKLAE